MKLRTCKNHAERIYTLKEFCPECGKPTQDAHYKFIKLPNAPKSQPPKNS
jgi:predicted amidophosphoribosyltransferase